MSSKFAVATRIAAVQHGRVTSMQLTAAGIDRHTIRRWLADGRLHRVHHGVYAVGHLAPSVRADYMAAVLACGEGARLSHSAGAYLMRLVRAGFVPRPEVTVPTRTGRRRPGIIIHRVETLDVLDTAQVDNVPTTAVPRILLELAPRSTPVQLTRMCHEAWVRHRIGPPEVESCIARYPAKHGAAKLRRAMSADVTLSFLEAGFLKLLRTHDLPLPRTNIHRRGDKVDCHWPHLALTIELLSYGFHGTRRAFEDDVARRRRSSHLAYTYGDIFERGASTIAELRPMLEPRRAA